LSRTCKSSVKTSWGDLGWKGARLLVAGKNAT